MVVTEVEEMEEEVEEEVIFAVPEVEEVRAEVEEEVEEVDEEVVVVVTVEDEPPHWWYALLTAVFVSLSMRSREGSNREMPEQSNPDMVSGSTSLAKFCASVATVSSDIFDACLAVMPQIESMSKSSSISDVMMTSSVANATWSHVG